MHIEEFGADSSWVRHGDKVGGARGSGDLGGIYKFREDGRLALIKRDPESPNFDIAEYMSSRVFQKIAPGYGAKVKLMVPQGVKHTPGDGAKVYVRSEFFEDYSDMFQDMDKHLPEKVKPSKFFRKDGRPLMMGTREKFTNIITKAFKTLDYQGFDKIAPASLIIGDFDTHSGNIGVVRKPGEKPSLRRIDFGWGFANLTRDVHPHSHSKHLPGMGPTNHFREFPRKLKLTDEFVKGLDTASDIDLGPVLEESFTELQKFYDETTLKKWAQHAMPEEFAKRSIDEIKIDDIKKTLKDVIKSRQASIKELSLQIKVGLLIKKEGKDYKVDRAELKSLVEDNWKYFQAVLTGEKKFKFRDPSLRKSKVMNLAMDEITAIRKELIQQNPTLVTSNIIEDTLQKKIAKKQSQSLVNTLMKSRLKKVIPKVTQLILKNKTINLIKEKKAKLTQLRKTIPIKLTPAKRKIKFRKLTPKSNRVNIQNRKQNIRRRKSYSNSRR